MPPQSDRAPRRSVAVLGEEPGWHGQVLRQAFSRLGVDCCFGSLTAGCLDLSRADPRSLLPEFRAQAPAGVLVRAIPGGTLEQLMFRLSLLQALELQGIPVFNSARALELSVDKGISSLLLRQAGLPIPPTWVCESVQQARALYENERQAGRKLVLKPLFGSQGRGLRLLDEAFWGQARASDFSGVYYLQTLIERQQREARDFRVFVLADQARAAMSRHSSHWITNRAHGGRCEPLALEPMLCRLAQQAVSVLGLEYGGVDLIRDATGQLLVLEVNGIPFWQGLQQVCQPDLAALLAQRLVQSMRQRVYRSPLRRGTESRAGAVRYPVPGSAAR